MAGRLREDDELTESHEINITPFIDVILVLLIIFMVAAPLSTVDIPVELPVAVATPQPRPEEPVFLTIQSDMTLSVGEKTISREALATELDVAMKGNKETRLYVRADKDVPYGELMNVMNLLRSSGYLKVGLVGLEGTAPPAATSAATGE
jgi:biopolymer transport protein ExbD